MTLVIPEEIDKDTNEIKVADYFELYDTSYRPLGCDAGKYIDDKNFQWLIEI